MNINYSKTVGYDEDGNRILYIEGACDHTETKPTGTSAANISDGSIIVESDTGDVYFFNKKTGTWIKQFSFQG